MIVELQYVHFEVQLSAVRCRISGDHMFNWVSMERKVNKHCAGVVFWFHTVDMETAVSQIKQRHARYS